MKFLPVHLALEQDWVQTKAKLEMAEPLPTFFYAYPYHPAQCSRASLLDPQCPHVSGSSSEADPPYDPNRRIGESQHGKSRGTSYF
jgi:hypothetical protein